MENQFKDLTIFNGGLNFDDEPRNIPNGDYTYAMCCRNYNGLEQSMGAIQNVKGNTLIEFELPSGDNTVIGTATNVEDKGIVYFVWNSLSKHCILQYLVEKREIEKILWEEPILGFRPSHRIYHANILDNKLFWTDGFNHPRKINILRAKEYTQGTGGYATLDKQTLDSIKYPPPYPPQAQYDSTGYTPGVTNNIKGRSWQFAYSYIYDDFEPSRLSEFSTILTDRFRLSAIELPSESGSNYTYLEAPEYYNNKIKLSFNSGHDTVIKIILYARDSQDSTFFRITEIDKLDQDGNKVIQDNQIIDFDFLNDGIYSAISIEEGLMPFDSVPVKSFGQEVVDGNVLTYANNVMNYPRPVIDIKITPKILDNGVDQLYATTQPNAVGNELDLKFNTETNNTGAPVIYQGIISEQITIPNGETLVHFRERWPSSSDKWEVEELGNPLVTINPVLVNSFDVAAYPYSYFKELIDYLVTNKNMDDYYLIRENGFDNFIIVSSAAYPNPDDLEVVTDSLIYKTWKQPNFDYSLKRGTRKRFGILYKDFSKRSPGVVSNTEMVVDIPFYNTNATDDKAILAEFEINNQPPVWAYYFQFVISQSSFIDFTQSYVKGSDISGNPLLGYTIKFNKSLTDFKSQLITTKIFQGEPIIETWVFNQGDRIRLISNDDVIFDYPITSVDDSTGDFSFSGGRNLTFSNDVYYKFEVYRPQKEVDLNDETYLTIGDEYRVMNPETPERYHNINPMPIPLPGSPAEKTGIINFGDVYNIFRFSTGLGPDTPFSTIESLNPSFRYTNKLISLNRPTSTAISNSGVRLSTMITNGGRLFVGTEVNDILRFDGSGTVFLTESYGPINKIHLVGYVLKALQDTKLTSIYIGRVVVNASDGNTRETLSNDILGTINPYEQNVGCIDPGSVVSNVRHLYFFDRINGQFYRDAPNGPIPISEYKMSRYFDNLSKNWGNKQMFCEFNENLNELNVTTYEEVLLNAQGLYDASEEAFGLYGILLTASEAAQVPNGATVTFGDGIFSLETTVAGRTVTSSGVIILMSIPSPNPLTLEQDQPVFIDYRAKGLGETLTFYEKEARWKTFMPYIPNAYGRFGRAMVSFVNGQLWLHEDNEVRNTFYGVATPSVIEFVSNINPTKIKVFDNIAQYANSVWDSPTDADIKVLPNALHPNGMISRLKSGKYVNKEGIFYAEFLRDINSPGAASHKLLNGRRLRGELLSLRLTNTATNLVTLSKVIVYSQPSEISS